MDRLLQFLLKTFIRRGTFRVTTSRGTVLTFGDGTGQPVSVRFATRAAEWGILLDPELKFGESYMNGSFVVEQGTIADVLAICLGQNTDVPHWARPQMWLRYLDRRLKQFNPRKRARRNVAHHYDLDGRDVAAEEVEQVVDVTVFDGELAVHVGLAERQPRAEGQANAGPPCVNTQGDVGPRRRTHEAVRPAGGVDDRQLTFAQNSGEYLD